MKNKNIIIAIVVVVVILFAAYIVFRQSQQTSLKIGVVGPLTGNQASYGIGAKEGIDLAFNEVGSVAVQGRKIELVYEDTAGEVKNAVSAVQKLINVDGVVALVSIGPSQEAVALAPVAENSKTPLYTVVSQAPDLTDAGDYVFRGMPEISGLGSRIAEVSFGTGLRRAGIIVASYNQATVDAVKAFKDKFETLGGKVVATETYGKDTAGFKTYLEKVSVKKPDVIFLSSLTNDVAIILKQKQELGTKHLFVSLGGAEDQKVVDVARDGSEGLIFTTFNGFAPESFATLIENATGGKLKRWNVEGYEALRFLAQALGRAKVLDRSSVRDAMASIKEFNGVTQVIKFDEKGNASREVYVKVIRNGQFVRSE